MGCKFSGRPRTQKSLQKREEAMQGKVKGIGILLVSLMLLFGFTAKKVFAEWPRKPIEFVIPAGTGGGADKYARFIVSMNMKHHLLPQPMIPVNKVGGAGAIAMNYVLSHKGDDHMIVITLNSFLTTPAFQHLPWTFRNFTPIALLALDNFPLWVHKDSPWKTFEDFIAEAKRRSITVGGTGSKQEDEIVFRAIEKIFHTKPFRYVPFKGGGAVAKALVGKQVEATVNQVSEAGPYYPDFVRPLIVFQEKRLSAKGLEWVPTSVEKGINFTYNMMRAIFAPPGISEEAKKGLVDFFCNKLFPLKEWQDYMKNFGMDPICITGDKMVKIVEKLEKTNLKIMREQGWIK